MGRVNGKVVLVTGGAMGMGKSHSELLAAEGAHVFVCDIDAEKGRQVVDDIGGRGARPTGTQQLCRSRQRPVGWMFW
jgi:cyclopentanol dehydrogenase